MIHKRAVVQALRAARVPFQESRSILHLLCPFHKDKETPSLVIYTNKSPVNFYCFGCRRHGTWNDLAPVIAAGELASDWDDPEAASNLLAEIRRLFPDTPALPPDARPWTSGAWRGMSEISLAQVRSRWWYDEIDSVRRILWPVWDVHAELMGWVARDIDNLKGSPRKYRNMPGMKALGTLWPLPTDGDEPETTVVLVEGILDALRLLNAGIPALAALGGGWGQDRTSLLTGYLAAERVVLAFDGDPAGQGAARKVYGHLKRYFGAQNIWLWEWPDGADPGDAPQEEVDALRKEIGGTPRLHPWLLGTPNL